MYREVGEMEPIEKREAIHRIKFRNHVRFPVLCETVFAPVQSNDCFI